MSRRRNGRNGFKRTRQIAQTFNSVAKAAFTGLKIAQALAAVVNTEWKFLDTEFTAVPTNAVPQVVRLSAIPQGDDVSERSGDSILPKALDINYRVAMNSADFHTGARIIVFRDMENDGTAPVAGDVIAVASNINTFMNLDNRKRFRILHNKLFSLNINGRLGFSRQLHFDFNKPLRNANTHRHVYHIRYDGTSASDADGDNGQLYMLMLTSESVNGPTFDVAVRLRYIDN